jgi:hypothetical protein
MTSHDMVGFNNILQCNILTMNSAIAPMTSHDMVEFNNILQ